MSSGTRCLALLVLAGMWVPALLGQSQTVGKWSTASYTMPINPIHVALLNNGKILVVAGSGNCPASQSGCPPGAPFGPGSGSGALLLNPTSGNITQFNISWDMFCNGMVVLQDGRALISGGTLSYDPFHGSAQVAVFDPSSNKFTNVQSMARGRWYPTLTTLGDGRVMAFSGQNENGNTNTTVEFYTVGAGWSTQFPAGWTPDLYPRLHLLPNGKVFYSGSQTTSMIFDPSSTTWTTSDSTNFCCARSYGSSVLLPLTPGNNFDPKILILGGDSPATATTELIDMGAGSPAWQSGPNMSQPRTEMNAVILPSGKVLALGGSQTDEEVATVSLNADLYDPASKTFSAAGANSFARLYHSVALLLPDATVWVAGSNPTRGTYENHVEIYQPAYLFQSNGSLATRPSITNGPGSVGYGDQFTVQTPDASNISSVVLIRNGTVTHSFGMDQRMVGMSFTTGSGSLTVTAPSSGNIAPPGYYMLFILNNNGVPSVANSLLLSTSATPAPTVSSISPTSGLTSGGTAVTIAGTGFQAGATVSLGGTAATGVNVASSTSITATTAAHAAGAVDVAVTNSDTQSGTLTQAFTYTSASNPPPTVSSISPGSGLTSGGTAVTITGTGFLTGATLSLGGTSPTGVRVVSSTSITATTAAHSAGAVDVVVTNTDAQTGKLPQGFDYVTPNPTPTVTSVAPGSGPAGGGTQVNITGTGFASGATVNFGTAPATAITVVSSTSITATTSAHAAGAVNVVVTNAEEQSGTLVNGYTFKAAPTVASITPNSGTINGGTTVTVTGTGFSSGATLSLGGTAATGVTVLSSTSITAVTPAHSTGAVNVVVTNSDGQSGTLSNGYTYAAGLAVTSVTPGSGPPGGGTALTITGTSFVSGATVSLGGTNATGVTVASATSITATAPAHAAGTVNVTVTNPGGQNATLAGGYIYSQADLGLRVASGDPSSVTIAAGQTASYTLAIGGQGTGGPASLTCTGAPQGATCSLPSSQTFSATVPSTFTVKVATTARVAAALQRPVFTSASWLWTLALGMLLVPAARAPKRSARRWRRYLWLAPVMLLFFSVSCGGGSMNTGPPQTGTPSGTFTVVVHASSGSNTDSTSLILNVQ